jgi:hypothetical protein
MTHRPMVGRLDAWLPISGSVAFVEAPAEAVARARCRWSEELGVPLDLAVDPRPFPDVLTALEPIDGTRELVIAGGGWSALFRGAAGADLESLAGGLGRRLACRAVYARAQPNLYASAEGCNTRLVLFVPRDGDNFLRSISVARDERWVFSAVGEPQPWEEPTWYRAPRPADRFPPELLHRYLDAIGLPPLDAPAWGPGGTLLRRHVAPAQRGGADAARPVAQTIAELHARMYGDRGKDPGRKDPDRG